MTNEDLINAANCKPFPIRIVIGSTVAVMAIAFIAGCTTIRGTSESADGTKTSHLVLVPPFGNSEAANFNTETIAPVEGGGEWRQNMTTGAKGTSGSELERLLEAASMLSTLKASSGALTADEIRAIVQDAMREGSE